MRIHVTDRQNLKWCRRYFYFNCIKRIELPGSNDAAHFWAGDLGHRCLAAYYRDGIMPWEHWPTVLQDRPFPRQHEEKHGWLLDVMPQVLKRYHRHYTEFEPETKKIISVETEYEAKIPGSDIGLVGTLDVVYEWRGAIWADDHKFYSAISWPSDESLEHDDQMTGYYYLLRENFPGRVIGGLNLNCILKAVPIQPPQIYGGKKLSRDKSNTCTYDTYLDAINEGGFDKTEYLDMLEYFKANAPVFFQRFPIRRSRQELDSWGQYLQQEVKELDGLLSMDDPRVAFYPSPNSDCGVCQYRQPCKILNERGDIDLMVQRRFVPRVGRE